MRRPACGLLSLEYERLWNRNKEYFTRKETYRENGRGNMAIYVVYRQNY